MAVVGPEGYEEEFEIFIRAAAEEIARITGERPSEEKVAQIFNSRKHFFRAVEGGFNKSEMVPAGEHYGQMVVENGMEFLTR